MFHELLEKIEEKPPVLMGIRTRGVYLAQRFGKLLKEKGIHYDFGTIDITFHRDDTNLSMKVPAVHGTQINTGIDDRIVVLFDDVVQSGRTVRSALDEMMDFGRPAKVVFVVLVDRDRRELPIQPDILGKFVPTRKDERIYVKFAELDGEEGVFIGGEKE